MLHFLLLASAKNKIFKVDKIDIDKVTTAIAAFEETLVTPNARFDKWLKGDDTAITKEELAGYELFKSSGCTNCHNAPAAEGNSFQKMGVINPLYNKKCRFGAQCGDQR